MITQDEAIQMAREVGSLVRNGDHCFDDEELTAFANAIERNVVNGLCEVEKDNEFLVAAVDSAIKDRDYYIAKLQEAERDAERYRHVLKLVCTDNDMALVDAFEQMPFEGDYPTPDEFTAAIDAAMEQTK